MPPGEKLAPILSENVQKYTRVFLNKRDQNIFCYYWKSADPPRALLLLSHGFTEHCMQYNDLAKEMARRGFFVFAHDHAGHGQSDGERAYVNDLQELVDDSVTHIQMIREEYPDLPLFVCGHSMGGSISILIAMEKDVQVSGIVLIAPALAPNPETASYFKITLAKMMSKFLPHCPLGVTDFSLSCQNPIKVEEMNKDPLRYRGFWKARSVVSMLQAAEHIHSKAPEINVPLFVLHGDEDKICHVSGAKEFYENTKSSDKTLKIYPGAYHSLLNEPEEIADDVFEKIVNWLEEKV